MNVLIVNHHGSLGKLFEVLASQMGCKVFTARRAHDFRFLVDSKSIDLIVCDATAIEEAMEHVTRMEFIQVLRDAGLKTRIFLFEQAGTEVTIDPVLAAKLGGIRIFRKPVSVFEVRNALNQVEAEISREQSAKVLQSRQGSPLFQTPTETRLPPTGIPTSPHPASPWTQSRPEPMRPTSGCSSTPDGW